MDKYIGKELGGRYVINEIMGIGGMAVVYKAYDRLVDRIVAVKILKDEFGENSTFRRRFSNESRVISMMSHVNIVDVFDVNLEGDVQYIVMEYIDGINLKEFMDKKGPIPVDEALFFVIQILNALTHAHERGIVHRDIKPHNIMLLRDGTVKVADFGIARSAKFDTVTMTDKAIGSVHYISPEQASGTKTDEKSDIYSLGVLLYEMITGKLPFEGDSPVSVALMQIQSKPKLPSEILPDIPNGLEEIIMKAMAKNPDNRYDSAAALLSDIEIFKANPSVIFGYNLFIDESPTTIIESAEALSSKKFKKHTFTPIFFGIITAFALFIIGIGIVLFMGSNTGLGGGVDVPSLVGEDFNTIINNKKFPNLTIIDSGKGTFTTDYEAGIIYKQSIEKGKNVPKGTTITVDVSRGINSTAIPDVAGYGADQAAEILRKSGFTVATKYETSQDVKPGFVTRTNPAIGTNFPSGSQIEIYVSSGTEVKKIDVPNVVGKYEKEALDILREAGFRPSVNYVDDNSGRDVGKVIWQSAIKQAEADTIININITQKPGA